jgi:hypothetical protein
MMRRSKAYPTKIVRCFDNTGGVPEWAYTTWDLTEPVRITSAIVQASSYSSLYLRIFKEGVTAWPAADPYIGTPVSSGEEFKFSSTLGILNALGFDFGTLDARVSRVYLFERITHNMKGASVTIRRDAMPFPWLGHEVLSQTPVAFGAMRVVADVWPVPVRLYADGVLELEAEAEDNRAFWLPRTTRTRRWTVDVAATIAANVREVALAGSIQGFNK